MSELGWPMPLPSLTPSPARGYRMFPEAAPLAKGYRWLPCLLLCSSIQRSLISCTEPRFFTSWFIQRFYETEEQELKKWCWLNDTQQPPQGLKDQPSPISFQGSAWPWKRLSSPFLSLPGRGRQRHRKGADGTRAEVPCLCLPAESRGRRAGYPCQRGSSVPHAQTGPAGSGSDCSNKSAPRKSKGIQRQYNILKYSLHIKKCHGSWPEGMGNGATNIQT